MRQLILITETQVATTVNQLLDMTGREAKAHCTPEFMRGAGKVIRRNVEMLNVAKGFRL